MIESESKKVEFGMTIMFRSLFGVALGVAFGVGIQQVQALPSSSIGYGQNPLVSIGGSAYHGETKLLLTAPVDQDLIVTDVILTSFSNMTCKRSHKSEFILGSGSILGQFETVTANYNGTHGSSNGLSIQHSFSGGIRIPAGDTLTFTVTESGTYGTSCSSNGTYGVRYMVSGYHAQM